MPELEEVTCPSCSGTTKEPDGKTPCKTCGGTGRFKVVPTSFQKGGPVSPSE